VEITAIGVVSSDYVADAASAVAEGDMGDTHFPMQSECNLIHMLVSIRGYE